MAGRGNEWAGRFIWGELRGTKKGAVAPAHGGSIYNTDMHIEYRNMYIDVYIHT